MLISNIHKLKDKRLSAVPMNSLSDLRKAFKSKKWCFMRVAIVICDSHVKFSDLQQPAEENDSVQQFCSDI